MVDFDCAFSHQFFEAGSVVTLSHLNSTSIFPKPVERQSVSLCLRVFCDETLSALKSHPELLNEADVDGTIIFLELFVRLWKILNVKGPGENR